MEAINLTFMCAELGKNKALPVPWKKGSLCILMTHKTNKYVILNVFARKFYVQTEKLKAFALISLIKYFSAFLSFFLEIFLGSNSLDFMSVKLITFIRMSSNKFSYQ